MSNIKVIDVNEEAKQETVEEPPVIEEATEQIEQELTNEVVDNPPVVQSTSAGVVQGTNPPVEEAKEEVVEKPKVKAKPKLTDKVDCKTCGKSLSYKNYRYRHEKICSEEPKPVKPQANPKGKSKPKQLSQSESSLGQSPKPQPIVEEIIPQQTISKAQLTQPVIKQILKPTNPLVDITNHYQLLQQQYIQQKQAKYQNLCQNMFAPKSKKR